MNHVTETKKLNNKGFSLVELIIVIAIMAVLIGVLAPQYLKYVEKSRKSADLDNFQTVISAVQVYYSNPENTLADGSYEMSVDATSGAVSAADVIKKACTDSGVDVTKITMKSKACKGKKLTFEVASSTGKFVFTINDSTLASDLAIGNTTAGTP